MMIWTNAEIGQAPISVTVSDQPALLEDLRRRFENGQGFSVATLNLDHVVKLSRDPAFSDAYARHSHITADGRPIVWLARLAGQKEVTLVPGSELIEPVSKLAVQADVPVALLGSSKNSLDLAAKALQARHAGLRIVGRFVPSMGFDPASAEADQAIEDIRNCGAKLVFLALGAPKQECFAARAQDRLPHVGFISVGAGLDFISGIQTRAPKWVRGLAAEWLWRLLSDPVRLSGRYLACLVILPRYTARALLAGRKRKTAL